MKSDAIKKGVQNAPHRAMFYATGVTKEEMDKPFIGIASSYNDIIPGHVDMRQLERFIEKGIHSGGGWPLIFGVPGICDGIAMGHDGMHYSLPSIITGQIFIVMDRALGQQPFSAERPISIHELIHQNLRGKDSRYRHVVCFSNGSP